MSVSADAVYDRHYVKTLDVDPLYLGYDAQKFPYE
jgi:hypothetical protein